MPRKSKTAPVEPAPPAMGTPEPTAAEREAMLKSLAGDSRFHVYMQEVKVMREQAIFDLCNDDVVASHTKLAAAVGEIRCYNAMLTRAPAQ